MKKQIESSIDDLFADTTVPAITTRDMMADLRDKIQELIDVLDEQIENE